MLRSITFLSAAVLVLLLLLGFLIQPQISDWKDFWPNLAVETISGLMFGIIVTAVLDFQRRRFEALQSEKVTKEAKRRYLSNIKQEINDNIISFSKPFQRTISDLLTSGMTEETIWSEYHKEWGQYLPEADWHSFQSIIIRLPKIEMVSKQHILSKTTYWEALVPSGLLPALLDENLLGGIADFYHMMRVVDKGDEIARSYYTQQEIEAAIRGDNYRTYQFRPPQVERIEKNSYFPTLLAIIVKGTQLVTELEREIEG